MFLSCRPGSFGTAADQAYAHLASWGVRHVEIGLPTPEEGPHARAALQRHGLEVSAVQVGMDLGNPRLLAQLDTAVGRAVEEFGAPLVLVSAHAGRHGMQAAHDALFQAGDVAMRHGAVLLLETHPDLVTNGAVGAVTMRAVNHPQVRINWDPANVHFYNERCDGNRELELALPYVAAVHLKDTAGGFHAWEFPGLGEGVVDFGYLLRRLREIGFRGPCTLEIEGSKDERLTPGEYVGRVQRSIEYLRRLGYFHP